MGTIHILEGKSLDKIVDIIVSNIKSAVIVTFGPLSSDKTSVDSSTNKFTFKNPIPKEVLSLIKVQARVSRSLRKVKSITKCIRMVEIYLRIKQSYLNRKKIKEMKIFEKKKCLIQIH